MNKKYRKYLTEDDIKKLKEAEKKYFQYNVFFWTNSALFLLVRPLKRFKIFNFYLSLIFLIASKNNSIFLLKDDILSIRRKVSQETLLKVRHHDLFDDTLIPDWRCYLYYYKLI